jgi:tetratricopeptide (TPR) repeat protein
VSLRATILVLVLAVAFWGGAVFVSPLARAERAADDDLMYYPSGRFVKEGVLGFGQAAASIAWLRTVQYYGEHKRGDMIVDMMYHLCDIVSDLDPQFEEPYAFGSFVLFTDGEDPEKGFELLEKARENNPESWRIFFESGFAYYVFQRDYAAANRYFQRAAQLPGAPDYVSRFAAFSSRRAGDLNTSLYLYAELAQRTDNPKMREWAEAQVARIQAEIAASKGGETP